MYLDYLGHTRSTSLNHRYRAQACIKHIFGNVMRYGKDLMSVPNVQATQEEYYHTSICGANYDPHFSFPLVSSFVVDRVDHCSLEEFLRDVSLYTIASKADCSVLDSRAAAFLGSTRPLQSPEQNEEW